MIITVIADGLKAPAIKAAKKLVKAERAIVARILQEIVLIKSTKVRSVSNHGTLSSTEIQEKMSWFDNNVICSYTQQYITCKISAQ